MLDLTGKVALVAGGAGYLAQPICEALAAQGAAVMVADISDRRIAFAEELQAAGRRVAHCALDVADPDSSRAAVQATAAAFGRLDVLVNATFWSKGGRLEDLQPADFDRAAQVNLSGGFALARDAAEAMTAGGSIVWFASMYGLVAPDPSLYEPPMTPNPIEYGACKAGVLQMVRYLAAAWGPRGIRVNAIAPGPFPGPSQQSADPAFTERLGRRTMLGRIGKQHETAGPVVFLASDAASYVTGHTLTVDGGWTQW